MSNGVAADAPSSDNGQSPPAASSTTREPALRLEHVHVRFGGIKALTDVTMGVTAGEVCGLIGPNGAGKTTLFDAVSGVRMPDEGTVYLNGSNVTRKSAVDRARWGMRRTFQRVQTFGWLSVEDNVLAALEWKGGGGGMLADMVAFPTRSRREKQRREQVNETLEMCGLQAVSKDASGSLPIGLARMVEVARAIVAKPKVLMLDEPTSGLDEPEAERLGHTIQAIRADGECAVLLVEHDVSFVMGQCDRIVVLDLGQVLAVGTPAEVQSNPAVRAAYLGE
jgi:ABC-type branched-subunit amino acid transport system ATPase component